MLGMGLDGWNVLMVSSLGLGALAAFALVVSTVAIIKLQKASEIETRAEFDKYKLDAGKEIAGANERTAKAELALEKLKAPRFLTPEQQTFLESRLQPFKGQPYTLGVATGDEPMEFLCLLDRVLQLAGWMKKDPTGDIVIETPCGSASQSNNSGVKIYVATGKMAEFKDAIVALATSLSSFGIAAAGVHVPDEQIAKNPNAIQVAVGIKPLQ